MGLPRAPSSCQRAFEPCRPKCSIAGTKQPLAKAVALSPATRFARPKESRIPLVPLRFILIRRINKAVGFQKKTASYELRQKSRPECAADCHLFATLLLRPARLLSSPRGDK